MNGPRFATPGAGRIVNEQIHAPSSDLPECFSARFIPNSTQRTSPHLRRRLERSGGPGGTPHSPSEIEIRGTTKDTNCTKRPGDSDRKMRDRKIVAHDSGSLSNNTSWRLRTTKNRSSSLPWGERHDRIGTEADPYRRRPPVGNALCGVSSFFRVFRVFRGFLPESGHSQVTARLLVARFQIGRYCQVLHQPQGETRQRQTRFQLIQWFNNSPDCRGRCSLCRHTVAR
jgi:hypothetical protein